MSNDLYKDRQAKGDLQPYERKLSDIIAFLPDAYDAMTRYRTYGDARSDEEAITEIKRCSGTQFNPEIVRIFVEKVMGKVW